MGAACAAPKLLHIPLPQFVWKVVKLLMHHLLPLWHGEIQPLFLPWPLAFCLFPATSGHYISSVLVPEFGMVFPHPMWSHSQTNLRYIDNNPFLTLFIWQKRSGFSLLSVSFRGSPSRANKMSGVGWQWQCPELVPPGLAKGVWPPPYFSDPSVGC